MDAMRAWTAVRTSLVTPLAYGSVALAWAGSWIIGKIGLGAVPPLELTAVRFAIAGAVLLAIAAVTRTSFRGAPVGAIVASAFAGYFASTALAFLGSLDDAGLRRGAHRPHDGPGLTALAATFVGERLDRARLGAWRWPRSARRRSSPPARREGRSRSAGLSAISSSSRAPPARSHRARRGDAPLDVAVRRRRARRADRRALMLFPLGFLGARLRRRRRLERHLLARRPYLAIIGTVGSFIVYY